MQRPYHRTIDWLPSLALAAVAGVLLATACLLPSRTTRADGPTDKPHLDPAAWGSDHVGQPVPLYTEGGECLFCHRHQVGVTWQTNKHNRTIRDAEPTEPAMIALRNNDKTQALADEVQLLLGDTRAQRYLRRSEAYGKADLLTPRAEFGRGARARLREADDPHWDTEKFAQHCAGCHTTAFDSEALAFVTVSLDCYVCHGDAPVDHANDTTLMPLAKERRDSPAAIASICGSCHIRHGKSKSTGLPFPNNFVAGDNLFKDFEVDWSVLDATGDQKLNPADAHVLENLRDVVLLGSDTTCLACHDVHTGSSAKHRELPATQACWQCHTEQQPITGHLPYEVHSERCEY